MEPLAIAKSADSKQRCVVFGYIHDMESKLKLREIASLIINIVLGFYYHGEFIAKFLNNILKFHGIN